MKQRLLALIMTLVMVIGLMPTVALAEDTASVQTEATALAESVSTAEALIQALQAGGEITLDADVSTSELIAVPEGVTAVLDLNGHKIDSKRDGYAVENNGTLTINDSVGNGIICHTGTEVATNYSHDAIRNFGTLTINGGTFGDCDMDQTNANPDNRGASVRNQSGAICTINGGFFTCGDNYWEWGTGTGFSYAIRNYGDMTINDATLYGAMNGGIASEGFGTLTINGGSFSVTGRTSYYLLVTGGLGTIAVTGGTFTKTGGNGGLLGGFSGMPSWDASEDLEENGYTITGGTFIKDGEKVNMTPVAQIDETKYTDLAEAFADANDGDVIIILSGTHTAEERTEIAVNKAVTVRGEGESNRSSVLENYVFNVESTDKAESGHGTSGVDHVMNVTFENLSFTGSSQIKVGFKDMQNSAYETLETTYLTVDNCYAYLTADSDDGADKGQLIYLNSTYNTNLDLTVQDSTLINAHTIAGEDKYPIVNGNGTNLVKATITGNTFGSAEHPCAGYAVKFGRRQDNAAFTIADNTAYATAAVEDFYLLNLWQSGRNPYYGLQVVLEGNTISCTAADGKTVTPAYIENSVVVTGTGRDGEAEHPSSITASGNTVNGSANDTLLAEARIGDCYYGNFRDALTVAASGSTVTLMKDVTWSGKEDDATVMDVDGVTLDLNGFSLTAPNFSLIFQGDNFVIRNGSLVCSDGISYALCIGDERETSNILVENVTTTGGIDIYNAHNVTLRNVDVTGTNYYAVWCDENGQAIIESGTFRSNGAAVLGLAENVIGGEPADVNSALRINGGNFDTSNGTPLVLEDGKDRNDPVISGGYFTANPRAYVERGKAAVAQTNVVDGVTYYYTVGEAAELDVETAVSAGTPSVTVPEGSVITKEALEEALESEATAGSIADAAVNLSNNADVVGTEEAAAEALGDKYDPETDTITVVMEPYLEVQVTGYDSGAQTLTMEINAYYNVKATTDVSDMCDDNTEILKEAQPMTVTTPMTITIPLPTGFAGENTSLYVKHEKEGGKVYYHLGTVADQSLTFTNTKGFSTFTILGGTTGVVEAQIGDVYYATLQEAVNDVADGQTIHLLANGEATVSRAVSFQIDANGHTAALAAGSGYSMQQDGNVYTFTYRSSSSGSGYAVTIQKSSNGSVTASASRASKGTKVTLTVKPDDGYVLDTLTVTDQNGKAVELTKVSDTKYTFTMPASAVTVKAAFADQGLPFTDVSGHWALDAIEYVYDNGMMNGTTATKFGPEVELSRGMLVTILYRLEGEPTVDGSTFDDVNPSQYYADPIAWAAKHGIVTGYTETTFGPEDSLTREQMAAILYRYASYKGYDVTGSADLSVYTDADSISSYAKDAMAWANGEGLITGVTATTLNPKGAATRAHVATILMRFCENVAK